MVEHVGGARVAQHVRRQPVAEAGPVAVLAHDRPRALAGQPPAPRVQEHRLGVAAAGPALGRELVRGRPATSQAAERVARRSRPIGTMRSLAPLPKARSRPPSRSMSAERQPDQLGDAQPGAVEHLEDGPVAAGDRRRRRRTASSRRVDLGLGERLGQPRGHPGHLDLGGRVGRDGRPRRRGTGAARGPATRAACHADAGARPWLRRRADVGGRPSARSASSRARPRVGQPGAVQRAGRAGRRRACWPSGPARPPATSGTPRPRAAAARRAASARADDRLSGRGARRASSRPMIVLASMMRAVGDHRRHVVERRRARSSCAPPRRPAVEPAPSSRSVRQEHVRVLVAEARRVVELGQLLEAAGPQADLLDQLALGGRLGRLARRRRACRPGSRAARGRARPGTGAPARPVPSSMQRHHRHRARVVHDVALERRSPSGPSNVPTRHRDDAPS